MSELKLHKTTKSPLVAVEKRRFLMRLKETGNVSDAARAAGRSRNVFYILREKDPWFAKRWYESIQFYIDGGFANPWQRREAEKAAITFARTLKTQLSKYQPADG